MFILAATMMAMAATAEAPRIAARSPVVKAERSGYPKLFRCASPIAKPDDQPGFSPACRAWRAAEMARISALPAAERVERVTDLRERMGLADDEGLDVSPNGALVPAQRDFASR